jgi:NTP pyrophosphatase (non-canonical NTP hydrolase)
MAQELLLDEYQKMAQKTRKELDKSVFYYGLGSESAGLLAIYKKALRDSEPETIWREELIEEMGDTLWYLSNISTMHGFSLNDCAEHKLKRFDNSLVLGESLTFTQFQEYSEFYRLQKEQDVGLRITASLLGIIAESGAVLYKYQQHIRGKLKNNRMSPKKIGTILWYLADIATNFKISLQEVAEHNMEKVSELFGPLTIVQGLFDEEFPWDEKFPRNLEIYFYNYSQDEKKKFCKLYCNGVFIGDRLDDNNQVGDGYRFHDAIHLSHMAILGWSPVLRSLLKLKRKSQANIDNSEDGARAIIIEEAIVALNFQYAKAKEYFMENDNISTRHLKQIKSLIQDLEVSACSMNQWKKAIIDGFKIYNQLVRNNGGLICVDLRMRTITYSAPEQEYLEGLMKNA